MGPLWHGFQRHWRVALVFLAVWLAAWGIVAIVWPYGEAQDWRMLVNPLLLLLPSLAAGAAVAWWRRLDGRPFAGLTLSAVAGTFAMWAAALSNSGLAVLAAVVAGSGLEADSEPLSPDRVVSLLVMSGLAMSVLGLLAGAIGGLAAGALATLHRADSGAGSP